MPLRCGLESKELGSSFLTVSTWCTRLKDLWLQGGGFDPWKRNHINIMCRAEVKLYKVVQPLMIYISEICSSTLIHFLSWLFRVGGGDVFRPSTVIPTHSLRCFSLYFGTGWLSVFLIDCDPDQWLAVAGLLSQYWIYTACTISFLVWDWRRFINEAQLPLLCFHTLAISWPVNVLSVSSHTCLLNNDPGVKSCTNKELSPLPLNTFQDFVCLITRKLIVPNFYLD